MKLSVIQRILAAMNNWNIPEWLKNEVRASDKTCVYCGVEMLHKVPWGRPCKAAATWERIINDARIITSYARSHVPEPGVLIGN